MATLRYRRPPATAFCLVVPEVMRLRACAVSDTRCKFVTKWSRCRQKMRDGWTGINGSHFEGGGQPRQPGDSVCLQPPDSYLTPTEISSSVPAPSLGGFSAAAGPPAISHTRRGIAGVQRVIFARCSTLAWLFGSGGPTGLGGWIAPPAQPPLAPADGTGCWPADMARTGSAVAYNDGPRPHCRPRTRCSSA